MTDTIDTNEFVTNGSMITNIKLDGENYYSWSRQVLLFLKGCGKHLHLTADKPADTKEHPIWEQDDAQIMLWLWNSMSTKVKLIVSHLDTAKEIWDTLHDLYASNVSRVYNIYKDLFRAQQRNRTVEEYYNELEALWNELNFYRPTTQTNNLEEFRLASFLSGLRPEYSSVCNQILSGPSIPTAKKAYAQIRRVVSSSTPNGLDSTRGDQGGRGGSSGKGARGGRNSKFCTHCKRTNHNIESCYEIHGLPENLSNHASTNMKFCTHCKRTNHSIEFCYEIHGLPEKLSNHTSSTNMTSLKTWPVAPTPPAHVTISKTDLDALVKQAVSWNTTASSTTTS